MHTNRLPSSLVEDLGLSDDKTIGLTTHYEYFKMYLPIRPPDLIKAAVQLYGVLISIPQHRF
jgi:hypothetical protein